MSSPDCLIGQIEKCPQCFALVKVVTYRKVTDREILGENTERLLTEKEVEMIVDKLVLACRKEREAWYIAEEMAKIKRETDEHLGWGGWICLIIIGLFWQ
jgi:hypothetical protein